MSVETFSLQIAGREARYAYHLNSTFSFFRANADANERSVDLVRFLGRDLCLTQVGPLRFGGVAELYVINFMLSRTEELQFPVEFG